MQGDGRVRPGGASPSPMKYRRVLTVVLPPRMRRFLLRRRCVALT
jgi:hypothetical protein